MNLTHKCQTCLSVLINLDTFADGPMLGRLTRPTGLTCPFLSEQSDSSDSSDPAIATDTSFNARLSYSC